MFEKFKEEMRETKAENVKNGVVEDEPLGSLQYKRRLQDIDDPYRAEDEGRERCWEYKTETVTGDMGKRMTRFDIILNEEMKDGWRFKRAINLDEFGIGTFDGFILVFERPVDPELDE